jgi:hypothetical protein
MVIDCSALELSVCFASLNSVFVGRGVIGCAAPWPHSAMRHAVNAVKHPVQSQAQTVLLLRPPRDSNHLPRSATLKSHTHAATPYTRTHARSRGLPVARVLRARDNVQLHVVREVAEPCAVPADAHEKRRVPLGVLVRVAQHRRVQHVHLKIKSNQIWINTTRHMWCTLRSISCATTTGRKAVGHKLEE